MQEFITGEVMEAVYDPKEKVIRLKRDDGAYSVYPLYSLLNTVRDYVNWLSDLSCEWKIKCAPKFNDLSEDNPMRVWYSYVSLAKTIPSMVKEYANRGKN